MGGTAFNNKTSAKIYTEVTHNYACSILLLLSVTP